MALDYDGYLKVRELLGLQQPRSDDEHDELLFIVVHQVYELWFKQLLHELDDVARQLDADELGRARGRLNRILKILKTMVQQIDVLETMTPLGFETFRDLLGSASGFQSAQFRELEYVLGKKDPTHLDRFAGTPEGDRLRARYEAPSIWARFVALLARRGHPVDPAPPTVSNPLDPAVQDVLVGLYRTEPRVATVCERLVDVDEGIQEWRYRHVMMVKRTIGTKPGTGGSPGAEYLRSTLFSPFFGDLWAIRERF